jgi:tetratricopeptide (TPR) repeat protein
VAVSAVDLANIEKLLAAAKRGRTSEVQDILDHGVNFNSAGENGQTALNAASYQGHLDVVRLLLTKGADVSAGAQKDGWTPLWSAVSNGHYEVARALIYHGANTETQFHDDTLLDRYEGREGTERIVTLLRYAQARPAAATDPLRAFPIDEDLAERARTGDRSAQQSVGDAHWQRGNAYLEQGSYDLAIESFAEALRINPQFAPACVNMGLASAALDDFASAIEAYDRALQIDPHLAPAYNNRGTAYRDQGNLQAAIESSVRQSGSNPQPMCSAIAESLTTSREIFKWRWRTSMPPWHWLHPTPRPIMSAVSRMPAKRTMLPRERTGNRRQFSTRAGPVAERPRTIFGLCGTRDAEGAFRPCRTRSRMMTNAIPGSR